MDASELQKIGSFIKELIRGLHNSLQIKDIHTVSNFMCNSYSNISSDNNLKSIMVKFHPNSFVNETAIINNLIKNIGHYSGVLVTRSTIMSSAKSSNFKCNENMMELALKSEILEDFFSLSTIYDEFDIIKIYASSIIIKTLNEYNDSLGFLFFVDNFLDFYNRNKDYGIVFDGVKKKC